MTRLYKQGEIRSVSTLRHEGIVVVNMPPFSETRHVFNGRVVEPNSESCMHISECSWNPFYQLETPNFFHTFVSETPEAYIITITMPSYISRYIRVQKGNRVLAVVGKAMARRQWTDAKDDTTNVHEQWKVYWRIFHMPFQCNVRQIKAWYGQDHIKVIVPRRNGIVYRAVNWVEERLWTRRARTINILE
ncbi:hypothetical protein LPJ75_000248 [Coemansia sp. RSA 2598]|nr:hypothetical protein LPJ75_000248 [Coemansia sp. RSA 2598]